MATAGLPITTLVPFATLPTCATQCYHLYDANGACVPPAAANGDTAQYASCFCNNALISAFSTGTAGVCDSACTAAADSGGLESIHNWFSSYCSVEQKTSLQTPRPPPRALLQPPAPRALPRGATRAQTTHGKLFWSSLRSLFSVLAALAFLLSSLHSLSFLSSLTLLRIATHYQWVIFVVVMVVGITSLWIGACVWHRRYLRKKDRQYALANLRASTGAASGTTGLNDRSMDHDLHDLDSHGMASPTDPAGAFAPNSYDAEKRRSNPFGRRR
ncbi:uncharacterized protein SPSK_00164 [Sporothrix schenckii 1099-18]|uniref:Integral membrane protein n=1 Tax=Sporothrix schenckii 1099-18 TaxID=1397361 RepID=A0A0F2M1Y1_SPOSC|nr:uncharacterized protein SPSK_00164 [Sporothrix schenckii 1099-18]KJR83712.1 hypothetical protein SPSK_00164 [Sporothrix schenckii 1099-18]